MKSRNSRFIGLCIAVCLLISCGVNPFTQSLAKNAGSNLEAKFKKASPGDLANLAGSGLSQAESKALINALANKDLSKLSDKQATNILNAATGAIIPNSIFTDIINKSTSGDVKPQEMFDMVIDAVNGGVNTAAISTLLNNSTQLNTIAKNSPEVVILATVSLLGEMVKESNESYTNIEEAVQKIINNNPEVQSQADIAAAIAEVLPKAHSDDVKAVANIMAAVYGTPAPGFEKIDLSAFGSGFGF